MVLPPKVRIPCRAVALACCAVLTCSEAWTLSRRPPPPAETAAGERATSRMEGVEVAGEDADGTVWQLRAAEGWGREGDVTGTLREVRATLRKGDHDLVLQSERARVDQGKAFHLSGGVRITWDAYAVQVEEATYLQNRGLVTSDSPVEFSGPGLHLTGVGAEVSVESRVVNIRRDARAVIGKEQE